MSAKLLFGVLISVSILALSPISGANEWGTCQSHKRPAISFVEIQSLNLEKNPPTKLTVKGKLKQPVCKNWRNRRHVEKRRMPAVVILHGSGGVDSRGEYYAQRLNAIGIATLEIDMWEARDVATASDRPPLPLFTYPDAFAALKFLADLDGIDPDRIGILGFSWGGVVSLAAAETLYAKRFGGGLRFAAHVAHYPVCYGYNNSTSIPPLDPPAERGVLFKNLTGSPVLIQVGTEDDYDNGADRCNALRDSLTEEHRQLVEVVAYDGAFHGWDRLQVPITVLDPFGDEGSIFSTGEVPKVEIVPDVDAACRSRNAVAGFFQRHL